MINKNEILSQLDSKAAEYDFPMLDNGYYYHGDQTLSIFRDNFRWAMVIEVIAFDNAQRGIEGLTTGVYTFGNCLIGGANTVEFKSFAHDSSIISPTFVYDDKNKIPYLSPIVHAVRVRDQQVPIVADPMHYIAKGIVFAHKNKITPWEIMRGLIPEYSKLF